ncbi:hypothetical protein MMC20_006324 [Loxospora ochrophaea]|nr:hypothetical protein [Loxospora ochrophaea]
MIDSQLMPDASIHDQSFAPSLTSSWLIHDTVDIAPFGDLSTFDDLNSSFLSASTGQTSKLKDPSSWASAFPCRTAPFGDSLQYSELFNGSGTIPQPWDDLCLSKQIFPSSEEDLEIQLMDSVDTTDETPPSQTVMPLETISQVSVPEAVLGTPFESPVKHETQYLNAVRRNHFPTTSTIGQIEHEWSSALTPRALRQRPRTSSSHTPHTPQNSRLGSHDLAVTASNTNISSRSGNSWDNDISKEDIEMSPTYRRQWNASLKHQYQGFRHASKPIKDSTESAKSTMRPATMDCEDLNSHILRIQSRPVKQRKKYTGKKYEKTMVKDEANGRDLEIPAIRIPLNSSKIHMCRHPDCDKRFNRAEHLKRHVRTHEPNLYYKCKFPLCKKVIKGDRTDNLTQHHRRHLDPSEKCLKHLALTSQDRMRVKKISRREALKWGLIRETGPNEYSMVKCSDGVEKREE